MLTFKNLTGKKETKGAYEEVVILSPTKGEFKLTPLVQEKMGIKKGDFGLVVEGEDGVVYIAKGKSGIAQLDENGKEVKNDRGRTVFVEDGFGGVISPAVEGSDTLRLTASLGWVAAGGSKDFNKYFTLGEPVEGAVPTGETVNGEDEMFSTVFYPLVHQKDVAKQAKTKSEDAGATATTEVSAMELENVSEVEEISNDEAAQFEEEEI